MTTSNQSPLRAYVISLIKKTEELKTNQRTFVEIAAYRGICQTLSDANGSLSDEHEGKFDDTWTVYMM